MSSRPPMQHSDSFVLGNDTLALDADRFATSSIPTSRRTNPSKSMGGAGSNLSSPAEKDKPVAYNELPLGYVHLHHLPFLYWLHFKPSFFQSHLPDPEQLLVLCKWMSTTLTWLPVLWPPLGLTLELTPLAARSPLSITGYTYLSLIIAFMWLLTGLFGDQRVQGGKRDSLSGLIQVMTFSVGLACGLPVGRVGDAPKVAAFSVMIALALGYGMGFSNAILGAELLGGSTPVVLNLGVGIGLGIGAAGAWSLAEATLYGLGVSFITQLSFLIVGNLRISKENKERYSELLRLAGNALSVFLGALTFLGMFVYLGAYQLGTEPTFRLTWGIVCCAFSFFIRNRLIHTFRHSISTGIPQATSYLALFVLILSHGFLAWYFLGRGHMLFHLG